MGSCWCKTKSRPISEPYLPAPEPQFVSPPATMSEPLPEALPDLLPEPTPELLPEVDPEALELPPPTVFVFPPPSIVVIPPYLPASYRFFKKPGKEVIDRLVREMLRCIACYVDNHEIPPALMHLHLIAEMEDGWTSVMSSVITVTSLENPFGPSLITVLLDDSALPCKDKVNELTRMFNLSSEKAVTGEEEMNVDTNMCTVLGCIAERLAGPNAVGILTQDTLEYLVAFLECARHPTLILYALFALEKFAITAENKARIKVLLEEAPEHLLLQLQKHIHDDDIVWSQVGFLAQWSLDNVFVIEGRPLSHEAVDMSGINAILNARDTCGYLKISPDGLMARCDSFSFESVRCTFQVDEGCWFYECTIMTKGIMQIGWATENSHFLNYEGYGVGDDLFSVSYDGCRNLLWYRAGSKFVMNADKWQPGDVLGCILDLLRKEVVFMLNGVPLAVHTEIFNATRSGFFAAASFMTYQQCRFNFGSEPYRFPPKDRQFLSFNDFAQLTEQEKKVIPRRVLHAHRPDEEVDDNSCALCCDALACCILRPCNHRGFCSICTAQLRDCPYCRGNIARVSIVDLNPEDDVVREALPLEGEWVNAEDLEVLFER